MPEETIEFVVTQRAVAIGKRDRFGLNPSVMGNCFGEIHEIRTLRNRLRSTLPKVVCSNSATMIISRAP